MGAGVLFKRCILGPAGLVIVVSFAVCPSINFLHISYKTASPNDSIFCGYDGVGCETKPIDFGCDLILVLATRVH
jgi:hypothetical protein